MKKQKTTKYTQALSLIERTCKIKGLPIYPYRLSSSQAYRFLKKEGYRYNKRMWMDNNIDDIPF